MLMIGVGGDAVHAENHADMLQSSIGIQQLRANGADRRLLRVLEHRRQPLAIDHFQIVVEQDDVFTRRRGARLH